MWQATDLVLSRTVAVKVLHADQAADPQLMARFKVEARRASSVTHQNIARIFDYNDEAAGQPFLVMEFVEGQSLSDLLAGGPLSVPATLGIVAQVAAGIDAAHKAGLFHLDVKSANVLLCADGAVKVTDFGIGTAGTDADLYSLGVLAHECLTGEPPVIGTPLLPRLPAATPPAVAALIMELTDKDPGGRPGSAAEVAKRASALREQFAPHPPATHSVAPPATQAPAAQADTAPMYAARALARRPRRGRLLIVTVVAIGVAVAALLLAGRAGQGNLAAQSAIPPGHATVRVDGSAFKNLPVSVVVGRLHRMGLLVRIRWRQSASVRAGLVIAIRPTGLLRHGSLVTVLGSGPPGSAGRIALGRHARTRHRTGRHAHHGGPTGKPSHSPITSSSASPHPTPTASPSPTGTPSPTPSQSPTSSPTPSGGPSSTVDPSPTGSASPSPATGRSMLGWDQLARNPSRLPPDPAAGPASDRAGGRRDAQTAASMLG